MALTGFVKLYRSLLDWEWHDDPATFTVFVHLLLMANYEPREWRGIHIARGQVVTGRKSLAEQTGLSEQSVRTALNHLKSTGEITIESTNRHSLISVVNYGKIQDMTSISTNALTANLTSDQPTANQPSTTTKEVNKLRRTKKNEEECCSRKRFTPPTVDEVQAYCTERGNRVDAQRFVDFYASKGWLVGKSKMRDWRAAVRNWERREESGAASQGAHSGGLHAIPSSADYESGIDPSGFGWA